MWCALWISAKSSYERFVVAAKEGSECYVEWMRKCNVFFSIAMVLAPATMLSVLPIGGLLFMKGSLIAEDFIMVVVLAVGAITPIITCMSYSDDLAQIGTIMGEVVGIMESRELIRPESIKEVPANHTITLKGVKFGYKDKEVLHGVDLQFKEGTVNALVGPSGSGKSTIAKLVAALWDVNEGSISIGGVNIKDMPMDFYNQKVAYVSQDNYLFDTTIMENIRMGKAGASDEEVKLGGKNVKEYSMDSLMKNFSFVFQNVYLFQDTIANNIRFGQPNASMDLVIEAAKKACCHDFIMQLPNGYETVIGEGGASLSGGEKQRISIARAIMKDAPIIILDEATANVDPENEKDLVEAIDALTKEKTILMIAHRLKTVRNADQILVVDKGQIAQQGTHDELMKEDGIYKRFVNAREIAGSWKLGA